MPDRCELCLVLSPDVSYAIASNCISGGAVSLRRRRVLFSFPCGVFLCADLEMVA